MREQTSDVRFRLWETLLTRLELAKDTASGDRFFFTFDEGEMGGVDISNFQALAIKKLSRMGAFVEIQEIEHPLQKEVGSRYPLRAIGFNILFEKQTLKRALRRIRIANQMGDVDAEPVFELTLDEASLIVTDLEEDQKYMLHKLQYDSQADQLFSYMFNNEKFQMTRKDIETACLAIDQKLGKIIRDAKLNNVLLRIFAPIVDNDRVQLRPIVTLTDLRNLGLSKQSVIEYLSAVSREKKYVKHPKVPKMALFCTNSHRKTLKVENI